MLIIVWKLATKTQGGERNKEKKKAERKCKLVIMRRVVLLKHTHENSKYCQHRSCMLEGKTYLLYYYIFYQAYAYNLILSMCVVHL